jgi:hypothetical protein
VNRRRLACAVLGVLLGIAIYGALFLPRPAIGGDLALARSGRPGLRVLFVGNSFTSANTLPALIHELAAADAGAKPVFAVSYTRNGGTLRDAAKDRKLDALLRDVRWDDVVLQEQSQIPSFPPDVRRREMDPFARALHERIDANGASMILFMTWGYERGDGRNFPGDTYAAMQARLRTGYDAVAAELPASVAPVGLAWAEAHRSHPELRLWAGDGKHPALAGSYLAACVLYAALTDRDPRRSTFTAGLGHDTAALLRAIAARYGSGTG